MKLYHPTLVFISGLIWFAVGLSLLTFGLNLITGTANPLSAAQPFPFLDSIASYSGGRDQAALILIALGLLIGQLKGKHVLGKSARKGIDRILSFPNPTALSNIYSKKYYILLGAMILLGMSMKFFNLSPDIRGFVDTAVGAALISGAMIYFRTAYALKKQSRPA